MAIIAFGIYHLFRFVHKSRSGQVVKAIVFLLVAMLLANVFDLRVVGFVLTNAMELGVIALLIIFQPELPICSKKRRTVLDDMLKTGTTLDCRVSAELLKNLFWNKAPLHDGAVIVRNGRIVGAGCMLPLSGNVNLSRDLGMRHRAGIGVSENSDAVVAIVSEETGSISVAVNGMLKRHLSPETLERLLRNELMPAADGESKTAGAAARLSSVFKGIKGDNSNGKEDS